MRHGIPSSRCRTRRGLGSFTEGMFFRPIRGAPRTYWRAASGAVQRDKAPDWGPRDAARRAASSKRVAIGPQALTMLSPGH